MMTDPYRTPGVPFCTFVPSPYDVDEPTPPARFLPRTRELLQITDIPSDRPSEFRVTTIELGELLKDPLFWRLSQLPNSDGLMTFCGIPIYLK
jgi:hypothetical protein